MGEVMAQAKMTTDHDTIKTWAEKLGGHPATVKGTERKGEEAGILRLDFDPPDEKLEKISWDEFFEKFDESHLAFLYQEKAGGGKTGRFHKFVERDEAEDDEDEEEDEDDEGDDEDIDEDDEDDDEDEDDEK